jgi:hypothetical protein
MLLQIRDFIQRERVVSTQQINREFHLDDQALEPMLAIWVRRGIIRRCDEKQDCQSSCVGCQTNRPVFYQYM